MKKIFKTSLKIIAVLLALVLLYVAYQEARNAYFLYQEELFWENLPRADMDIVLLDKNNELVKDMGCNLYWISIYESGYEADGYLYARTDSKGCIRVKQLPKGPLNVKFFTSSREEYRGYYEVTEYDLERGVVFLRFDDYEVEK